MKRASAGTRARCSVSISAAVESALACTSFHEEGLNSTALTRWHTAGMRQHGHIVWGEAMRGL